MLENRSRLQSGTDRLVSRIKRSLNSVLSLASIFSLAGNAIFTSPDSKARDIGTNLSKPGRHSEIAELESTSYNNEIAETSTLPTLEFGDKLEAELKILLNKINPDQPGSICVIDLNSPIKQSLIIDNNEPYQDPTTTKMALAVEILISHPGRYEELISRMLVDQDTEALDALLSLTNKSHFSKLFPGTNIDISSDSFATTTISDTRTIIARLFGPGLSESDREFLLAHFGNQQEGSMLGEFADTTLTRIGNIDIIQTATDRRFAIASDPDTVSNDHHDALRYRIFESLEPGLEELNFNKKNPHLVIKDQRTVLADTIGKTRVDKTNISKVNTSHLFANGTTEYKVTTKDDRLQKIKTNLEGDPYYVMTYGPNRSGDVSVEDYASIVNTIHLSDHKDISFDGKSQISVSVAYTQDFKGDEKDIAGQILNIQKSALESYDFLISVGRDGEIVLADVRSNTKQTSSISKNIRVGVISIDDTILNPTLETSKKSGPVLERQIINSGLSKLAMAELISQLTQTGTLEITGVTGNSKYVAELAQYANNIVLKAQTVSIGETGLQFHKDFSLDHLTPKDMLLLGNYYQKGMKILNIRSEIFEETLTAPSWEDYLSAIESRLSAKNRLGLEQELSTFELSQIFGITPEPMNVESRSSRSFDLLYIPTGSTLNISTLGQKVAFDKDRDVIQFSTRFPGYAIVSYGNPYTHESKSQLGNYMAYQVEEVRPDGSKTYKILSDLKGDETVVGYIPLESPLSQETLVYWKSSATVSQYLGKEILTLSERADQNQSKVFINPKSLETFALVYRDGEEQLLPVIGPAITYSDIYMLQDDHIKEGEIDLTASQVQQLFENQIANQIVAWGQHGDVNYKSQLNLILQKQASVSNGREVEITTSRALLKNISDDSLYVDLNGKFVYFDRETANLSTYNKETSSFTSIPDSDDFIPLKDYLESYAIITNEAGVPLQWHGMPAFTRNDVMYLLSPEGLVSLGSIYGNNHIDFVADQSLEPFTDTIRSKASQHLPLSRSFQNITDPNIRYIHASSLALGDKYIEQENSILDPITDTVYTPFEAGYKVDKNTGKTIFADSNNQYFVISEQRFNMIDPIQITSIDDWVLDNNFEQTVFRDRQTRMIVVRRDGFAFRLDPVEGSIELGNFESLQKSGLIGFELEGSDKFYTTVPNTLIDIIKSTSLKLPEKLSMIADPIFRDTVSRAMDHLLILDHEEPSATDLYIISLLPPKLIEILSKIDQKFIRVDRESLNVGYIDSIKQGDYIHFDDIPNMYIQVVLSSEDANHFRQSSGEEVGVNTQGVARAIIDKIFNQGVSGGSTIDMQAAKNLATSFSVRGDVNILRKLLEWGIAEALLDKLTPEQIFESYVNVISYGKVEGVKPAARLLFDKELEDLTLPQMALLAILPKNPNGQGLWSHSAADNWADNASALVRRMNENGYIHDSQKIAAQLEIYKFTHIDTKQDDLNFLKNHLNLNSDQFDRIKILANQYDQIEFQDRFIDITTSTREVSRNHTPMPNIEIRYDTETRYKDFLDILVDKGFFSGSDESYIAELRQAYFDYRESELSSMQSQLIQNALYTHTDIVPGPAHTVSFLDPNGAFQSERFWAQQESGDITTTPIFSNIFNAASGQSPILSAITQGTVPIIGLDGEPLARSTNRLYSVSAGGILPLPTYIGKDSHENPVELNPLNHDPAFLLMDPSLEPMRDSIMQDISGKIYFVRDKANLETSRVIEIGQTFLLGDGRIYVTSVAEPHRELLQSKYPNDSTVIAISNALNVLGESASAIQIYNSIPRSLDNPYLGLVGDLQNPSGIAANPDVISTALKTLGIESKSYTILNSDKIREQFVELFHKSKEKNLVLMAWIDPSLNPDIKIIDQNANPKLILSSKSERPVIIMDILDIDGKTFVMYNDPQNRVQMVNIDVFGQYLSPLRVAPNKFLVIGDSNIETSIAIESNYNYNSREVQIALRLEQGEYIYGSDPEFDKLLSINPLLQRRLLEQGVDMVANSDAKGFSAVIMDANGNLVAVAGVDNTGRILSIQETLMKSENMGSVMKLPVLKIFIKNGLNPYFQQNSGGLFEPDKTSNLAEAVGASLNGYLTRFITAHPDIDLAGGLDAFGIGKEINNPLLPSSPGLLMSDEWAMNVLGRKLTRVEKQLQSLGYGTLTSNLHMNEIYFAMDPANNGTLPIPTLATRNHIVLGDKVFDDPRGLDAIEQGLSISTDAGGTLYRIYYGIDKSKLKIKDGIVYSGDSVNSAVVGRINLEDKPNLYFSVTVQFDDASNKGPSLVILDLLEQCTQDQNLCIANNGHMGSTTIKIDSEFTPTNWNPENSPQKDLINLAELIQKTVNTYQANTVDLNKPVEPKVLIHAIDNSLLNSQFKSNFENNPQYRYILNRIEASLNSSVDDRDLSVEGVQSLLYESLLAVSGVYGAPPLSTEKGGAMAMYNKLDWIVNHDGINTLNSKVSILTTNSILNPGDTVWSKNDKSGNCVVILDATVDENGNKLYYTTWSNFNNLKFDDKQHDGKIRKEWMTIEKIVALNTHIGNVPFLLELGK